MEREYIKDTGGNIFGFVETDSQGNKTAKTKDGTILGYYKAKFNTTTTPTGKIVSRGDSVVTLILSNRKKKKR